jgi:sirohydrochlorin cobaltochelatase
MLGIILFAHGSRDPLWRQPFEAVARQIREKATHVPVRCAYLELNAPDLACAAKELIQLGVTRVRVTPLFLGTGKHAREDLPQRMVQLCAQHPAVSFELRQAVGEDPRLTALIAQIALEPCFISDQG